MTSPLNFYFYEINDGSTREGFIAAKDPIAALKKLLSLPFNNGLSYAVVRAKGGPYARYDDGRIEVERFGKWTELEAIER